MLDSFSFYLQSVTAYGLMALISPITFRCVLMHLLISLREWIDCIIDKILKNFEIVKFITTALKSILNLVKWQSLVVKC